MNKLSALTIGLALCGTARAITVEIAPGEGEAVQVAAANLRADLDRVCPDHAKDTRKIVVKTTGKGDWESSVRTYKNGVWTIAGADRRGTVYGIYAVSEELGVSPFHWWDDIPVEEATSSRSKGEATSSSLQNKDVLHSINYVLRQGGKVKNLVLDVK